ncbi:MAG: hypothetical protein V2A74_10220 [bacterium]
MQRKRKITPASRFVVCIDNSGYEASLERRKIYPLLPDPDAAEDNDLRIIDESGEDYLYEADRFVAIEVPTRLERVLLKEFSQAGLGMR